MGAGPGGKDVEDQLAAVDHHGLAGRLQFADLSRRQVIIEDHQVRCVLFDAGDQLLDLALADVVLRICAVSSLEHHVHDDGPRRLGQGLQFARGFHTVVLRSAQFEPDQDRPLPLNR